MTNPRQTNARRFGSLVLLAATIPGACEAPAGKPPRAARFEVRYPASVHPGPITGRVYVLLSDDPTIPERSRRALGHQPVSSNRGVPFFAVDVDDLRPGERAIIDAEAVGYPYETLGELPPGDYYAQALVNVYTRFERSDGHVVWAHMDRWEGQHFNWSPGNLISGIQRVRVEPGASTVVTLDADTEIPDLEPPPDTEWVRRVKLRSPLLSEFWGHPIDIGATVLLPAGFDDEPGTEYPAVYVQGHFSLAPPFGFSTEPVQESDVRRLAREERGLQTGYALYESWISPDFPRVAAITFQHPTPYFDDSYAVNSANNGPYADALVQELIPYLEERFRLIPEGSARVLTGGSTGGYEALALQVHQPRSFGGTWVFYPDPIDFRSLFLIDIYSDTSAFTVPGYGGLIPERYAVRTPHGQPVQSVRDLSRLARALGSRGRSTEYLEAWEAAFGPVGEAGYPVPLWDKATGVIDPEVAAYWRDNGFDLRHTLQENWATIGPDLVGKLHLYCGDMDDYYFNIPVTLLEAFLESTADPYYDGSFAYGRPAKGHGWHPMNQSELVLQMAEHMALNAPVGAPMTWLGPR